VNTLRRTYSVIGRMGAQEQREETKKVHKIDCDKLCPCDCPDQDDSDRDDRIDSENSDGLDKAAFRRPPNRLSIIGTGISPKDIPDHHSAISAYIPRRNESFLPQRDRATHESDSPPYLSDADPLKGKLRKKVAENALEPQQFHQPTKRPQPKLVTPETTTRSVAMPTA
jgi:hypothetical protein